MYSHPQLNLVVSFLLWNCKEGYGSPSEIESSHAMCTNLGFYITNASDQASLPTTRSMLRKEMVLVIASRKWIWQCLGVGRGFNDACDSSSFVLGHCTEMYCPEFWKEITVSEPIRIGGSHPQCDCVCVATCEIWLLICCFGTARKGMVASPE